MQDHVSHKSPSSQRFIANRERREILSTRRACNESRKEGTAYRFITALPKHPKAGRILSNANSSATLTGGRMKGKKFHVKLVTRHIERPLDTQYWERVLSFDHESGSYSTS